MTPYLNMGDVARARRFALHHHGGQKYGDVPYAAHLEAVVAILQEYGLDFPTMTIAGWLHDVVEDTGVPLDTVRIEFGDRVADLVGAVTGIGKNRRERVRNVHDKLLAYPDAITLKLADRLANVRASAPGSMHRAMYQQEWPAFHRPLFPRGHTGLWAALAIAMFDEWHPATQGPWRADGCCVIETDPNGNDRVVAECYGNNGMVDAGACPTAERIARLHNATKGTEP